MEITIKRSGQFGDGSVLIEVRPDQGELNILDQAERAGKVPALEAQIADLMAENKRVSERCHALEVNLSGANQWINELKSDCTEATETTDIQGDRIQKLEAERDALLLRVREYDNDRKTEKQRADENQDRAMRAEVLLEKARHDLREVSGKMARVSDKVWRSVLDSAMNHRGDPASIPVETVGDLANTVSAVRSIVGQP